MALDYDTLSAVNPYLFAQFGFHYAQPFVGNASDELGSAESVVTGGHAWTGAGQPQAALVLRTNMLGVRAAKLQMRAGASAMDALYTAVSTAKREADHIVSRMRDLAYQHQAYVEIDSNGVMSVLTSTYGDPVEGAEPQRIVVDQLREANLRMQSNMNYARSADLTASNLLARITHARPVFTTSASAKALAYNQAVHHIATANLGLANLSKKTWERIGPQQWQRLVPESWDWWEAGKGLLGIHDVQDLIETLAGEAKDVSVSEFDRRLARLGIASAGDFAAFFSLAGVTGKLFGKQASKLVPLAGWAYAGGQAYRYGAKDAHLEHHAPPRSLLERFRTSDPELEKLVDEYYADGEVDLAQAARLQAAGAPGDEDYLARAGELRERLSAWLDYSEQHDDVGSYPGPNDPESLRVGHDRAVATQLILELDAVLDDA